MTENPGVKQADISFEQLSTLVERGVAYAIIDPSGDTAMAAKLQSLPSEQAISLFTGTRFEGYTAIAPWLVRLNEGSLRWVKEELGETPWGVFVFSRRSPPEMFDHLRRYTTVLLPDRSEALLRFYDPRILPVLLASSEVRGSGLWNGIIAYGVIDGNGVKSIRPPEDLPAGVQPAAGLVMSPSLLASFGRLRIQDFARRCEAYFKVLDLPLTAAADSFFPTLFRYAFEAGIRTEIDIVRFLHLLLGWKEMRTVKPAREILKYPGLSGTDKVTLLCEMVAFAEPGEAESMTRAIDGQARAEADRLFLKRHEHDQRFLETHPDRRLTLAPADALWRKEWLALYTAEVCQRAHVTDVDLGSVQV